MNADIDKKKTNLKKENTFTKKGDSEENVTKEREKESKLDKQNREQKKDVHQKRIEYFSKIYWMCVIYLIFVALILSFYMQQRIFNIILLSDSVLITLLGTTTINVLGLFVIAMKWLYPKEE